MGGIHIITSKTNGNDISKIFLKRGGALRLGEVPMIRVLMIRG